MKEKLHSVLSVEDTSDLTSKLYNYLNIGMTIISLVPLMFNRQSESLLNIEMAAAIFFVGDYLLRWLTADKQMEDKSPTVAYLIYPFTFYAIVDILAVLPFLGFINQSLRLFRVFRLFRSLRVFRAFRLFQNTKSFGVLNRTLRKQKDSLMIVGIVVSSYIFVAALLVFNLEPDTFPSFLQAILWATESLTTATYSDHYPTSNIGQVLSIISYLVGVGIIALPTSILTAGYMDELEKEKGVYVDENDKESRKDATESQNN